MTKKQITGVFAGAFSAMTLVGLVLHSFIFFSDNKVMTSAIFNDILLQSTVTSLGVSIVFIIMFLRKNK